jgi:hypothetical protein
MSQTLALDEPLSIDPLRLVRVSGTVYLFEDDQDGGAVVGWVPVARYWRSGYSQARKLGAFQLLGTKGTSRRQVASASWPIP